MLKDNIYRFLHLSELSNGNNLRHLAVNYLIMLLLH